MLKNLEPYLTSNIPIKEREHYLEVPIVNPSAAIKANAYYFNNEEWAREYFIYCHRSETFKSRWNAAIGDWTDKIVVDIGCGPGNIFASLQGRPKLLIGIDVAGKSLEMAKEIGYLPLLANAEDLPLISGFADVVTLNAALHHCENMEVVLKEAARLVKPGGLIVTDHDPNLSAWNYKGLAKLMWNSRVIIYKILGKGFHKTNSQQYWALESEIHHKPGHGVTEQLFRDTLEPLGFTVKVYPHNHKVGAEVCQGKKGTSEFKYMIGNLLSGRNPFSSKSALSLMCVAQKQAAFS